MCVETQVSVTTASNRKYTFSFNGNFSLHDYIKKQSVRIGNGSFLRVNKAENDFPIENDEMIVNVESITSIEVTHPMEYE